MKQFINITFLLLFCSVLSYGQIEVIQNNNVGIGTSSPTTKLEVNGTIKSTTGYLLLKNNRFYGDGNSAVYYNSNNSSISQLIFRDKESVQLGRVYGSGNGAYFGLMDSSAKWVFLSRKNAFIQMRINNIPQFYTHANGTTYFNRTKRMEIGHENTGNRFAYIDLHGDDTNTDYALRLYRHSGGPNTWSMLAHKGTGSLYLSAVDAGDVRFRTNNLDRMVVKRDNGFVGIGTTTPTAKLHVEENNQQFVQKITNTMDANFALPFSYGLYVSSSAAPNAAGEYRSMYNKMNADNASTTRFTGLRNEMNTNAGGYTIGVDNYLQGEGHKVGMSNTLICENNYNIYEEIGLKNFIQDESRSPTYGIVNNLIGTGFGNRTGIQNHITSSPDTDYMIGTDNVLTQHHTNRTYGVRSSIYLNAASGISYGSYNYLTHDSPGTYGSNVYGVYSNINNLPGWAGFFAGDVSVNGSTFNSSDRKFKENIKDVKDASSLLQELQPRKYHYKKDKNRTGKKWHYGFVAQELETVLPDLVADIEDPGTGEEGSTTESFKAVNYIEIIPLLVQAVNEQSETIEKLNSELEELKACDCYLTGNTANQQEDNTFSPSILEDKIAVTLYPNPTDKNATLEIESKVSGVHQIHVYDQQGRLLLRDEIYVGIGKHQYEIKSSDWAAGAYYVNTTHQGISKSLKLIVTRK